MVTPKKYPTYGAGDFKAHCLRLMEKVARTGMPLVVTKRGKPLVRVVPAAEKAWGEAEWRERGRASLVLTSRDDDLVRPTGERWTVER